MKQDVILDIALEVTWTQDLQKKVMERIYYIVPNLTFCQFEDGKICIETGINDEDINELTLNIQKYISSLIVTEERISLHVLQINEHQSVYNQDPYQTLLVSQNVMETLPGVFVLGKDFLRRFKMLDDMVKQYALACNGEELLVPSQLPVSSLISNGYLVDFPHHAIFSGPLTHDVEALELVAATSKKHREDTGLVTSEIQKHLSVPTSVLAPTVCYHCFEALSKTVIECKNKVYTALGHCHRHESHNLEGLMRLQHFRMRELIYLGTSDFIEEQLNLMLDWMTNILTSCNVSYRVVVATDPFFLGEAEKKALYQTTFELKRELQIYIPHADRWIAVGSFNNHQNVIMKKYNIEMKNQTNAMSGCIGFGYERFIYALYSQFGFDDGLWPENFR